MLTSAILYTWRLIGARPAARSGWTPLAVVVGGGVGWYRACWERSDSHSYCGYNIWTSVGSLFEWDNAKRQANVAKHGVDFAAIDAFDWETALIDLDTRQAEPRWVATGFIGSRLHVAVYAMRGKRRRIISLRKANAREVRKRAEAEP